MASTVIFRAIGKIQKDERATLYFQSLYNGSSVYDGSTRTLDVALYGYSTLNGDTIIPTGVVKTYINNVLIETITDLSQTRWYYQVGPEAGTYVISAEYSGDSNYKPIALSSCGQVTITEGSSSPDTPTPPDSPTPVLVQFMMNDGTSTIYDSKTITSGTTVSIPDDDPERTNYFFYGWYTDSSCTTAFDSSVAITKDTDLYAKWALIVDYDFEVVKSSNFNGSATDPIVAGKEYIVTATLTNNSNFYLSNIQLTCERSGDIYNFDSVDSGESLTQDFSYMASGSEGKINFIVNLTAWTEDPDNPTITETATYSFGTE